MTKFSPELEPDHMAIEKDIIDVTMKCLFLKWISYNAIFNADRPPLTWIKFSKEEIAEARDFECVIKTNAEGGISIERDTQ